MDWKTIDEAPAEDPTVILLKGTRPSLPEAYERLFGRRRAFTASLVAVLLCRFISWSVAISAHLLLALVLLSIFYERPAAEESLFWASIARGNAGEQGKAIEEPKFDPPAEEPKKPEPDPPKPEPEPPKPEPTPVPAKVEAKTPEPVAESPNPGVGVPAENPKPAVIGGGATASGSPAAAAVSDPEVEKDPTAALRRRRAGDLNQLRAGTNKQIVVVTGVYDRVQDVLDRLAIPYTVISPEKLVRQDLSECLALLINCHNSYATYAMKPLDTASIEKEIVRLEERQKQCRKRLEATRDKRTVQLLNLELLSISSDLAEYARQLEAVTRSGRMAGRIGEFVKGGGYLFTSDWGLSLVEQALPGYIRNGGLFGPRTVDIRARAGKERHPLLEEVFYEATRPGATTTMKKFRWEVDSSSYLIRIERPGVEILVESPQLVKAPAVAVAFSPEGSTGKVLHVLSHFQKQATQQGDYALQNMLINFLLDRTRPAAKRAAVLGEGSVAAAERVSVPVPELAGFYQDEGKKFVLALPKGWTGRATTDARAPAAFEPEDKSAGSGILRVDPAQRAEGKTFDWDAFVRGLTAERGATAKITRRLQAFSGGQPALQVTLAWRKGETSMGALVYAVATPQGLYATHWTSEEPRFRELEPVFEKAGRSFMLTGP